MGSTNVLFKDKCIKFGGVNIVQTDEYICLSQQDYIDQIGSIDVSDASIKNIRKGRGKPAWVATWTRPDISYRVGRINQVTENTASTEATKEINKITKYLVDTGGITLKFPSLDKNSLYLAVYGDASFAGNTDLSSQMGGVIALRDGSDNCHILHWFSRKCPRVTSSILAAEVIACVTVYDIGTALKEVL
jgi:hypothetical protein